MTSKFERGVKFSLFSAQHMPYLSFRRWGNNIFLHSLSNIQYRFDFEKELTGKFEKQIMFSSFIVQHMSILIIPGVGD